MTSTSSTHRRIALRTITIALLVVMSMVAPFATLDAPVQNATAATGGTILDDYESGSNSGTPTDNTRFSVVSSNAISGTYSLEADGGSSGSTTEWNTYSVSNPDSLSMQFRIDNADSGSYAVMGFQSYDGGASATSSLTELNDNLQPVYGSGQTAFGSQLTAGEIYTVRADFN